METHDLTREEQIALVAMARHLVLIDGALSDSELFELIRIGFEMGKDVFEAALDATESWFHDREQVLHYAENVLENAARARVLSELARIAHSDAITRDEMAFMKALRERWHPH